MKEFKLDKIKATGTTVGDVHFPKVSLLLPFDGTNGATTTSDLSNNNKSSTIGGSATISTAQSKFGGSSLNVSSGYCDISSSDIIEFGTDDFTFELWYYKTSATSGTTMLFDCRTGSSGNQYVPTSSFSNENPGWSVYGGGQISSSISTSLDVWNHFAVVRNSGTTTMYINGASAGSFSDSNNYVSSRVALGAYRTLATQYSFPGYIDGFRITKGAARYTSAFTPPTTAHPTSAGDINKHIVVNSDADGVAIGTGGISQARIAKAWVNFNGTGTVAIRDSYNVSSITDTATGRYTINFSAALSNANFCFAGTAGNNAATTASGRDIQNDGTRTTTSLPIRVTWVDFGSTANTAYDDTYVGIMVFGN